MLSSPREKNSAMERAAKRGPSQKRMSSITRKLHWAFLSKRLSQFFWTDLLFGFLAGAGWCVLQETTYLNGLEMEYTRKLQVDQAAYRFLYEVYGTQGELLLSVPFMQPLLVLLITLGVVFVLQLLGLLFSCFAENRKIRKILSPINEIALQADELSRLSFSEDKYQLIEEAIQKIQPDQTGEERLLSFGDSDLSGVEAAMNNLLLRMRDAYRQQARFVNDASHELRTPIAVIQGYASMLDRWGKTDEKILEEGIDAIRNESDHMNHLVEQLLFLARGDSGKTSLSLEDISICDLMREIYEESFMIDENHLYRLKVPEEAVVVKADPGLLKQAVRILTDNAAKYTEAGEEILLSAGRNEEGVPFLQVQDMGSGMEEKDIPHIFDRFFRSDEVRGKEGTGLGLSIAKWIVDKHKGHFEVLSRKNLGTRIRILLPES